LISDGPFFGQSARVKPLLDNAFTKADGSRDWALSFLQNRPCWIQTQDTLQNDLK